MNKGIFDIHVIGVYFTSVHSNPWVFDTGSVAKINNSKQELQNEQRLVKGEVTMCVGNDSKVDTITMAHNLYLHHDKILKEFKMDLSKKEFLPEL